MKFLVRTEEDPTCIGNIVAASRAEAKLEAVRQFGRFDLLLVECQIRHPYLCKKCGTRISDPEQLGTPFSCPNCKSALTFNPESSDLKKIKTAKNLLGDELSANVFNAAQFDADLAESDE